MTTTVTLHAAISAYKAVKPTSTFLDPDHCEKTDAFKLALREIVSSLTARGANIDRGCREAIICERNDEFRAARKNGLKVPEAMHRANVRAIRAVESLLSF